MKKTTLIALSFMLVALAGALATGYYFLVRRERELDEYEQALFSEEMYSDVNEEKNSEDANSTELAF